MKKGNNRKTTLLATGLASLALLATISTATFAWFTINTTVTVGVSSLTAVAGGSIEISNDGSTWGENVSLVLDEMDSTVTDISGDGSTFYTKSGRESTDYVEVELQFRASSYYAIYLNSTSTVAPNASALTGSGAGNKSAYGNFSKDLIAAAVRVAFIYENEVQLVWAPNSNYTLTGTVGNYGINLSDGATKTYQYASAPGELGTFAEANANFLATSSSQVTAPGTDPTIYDTKNPVTTIVPDVDGVSKAVSVTVRIWIDGEDPECVNPFLGGVFNTTLGFSAVELVQETRPTVETVAVTNVGGLIVGYNLAVTGSAEDFEVSTNGGTSYSNYSAAAQYVNQTVLVRRKASATTNGIPGLSTSVRVGRLTQPVPTQANFTAEPSTRLLSANNYATSATSGGALQYSIDGGTNYLTLASAVTIPTNQRIQILVRYAENGNYSASNPIEVDMLGKRTTPVSTALTIRSGTGEITIPTMYQFVIAPSFSSDPTSWSTGSTTNFNDGDIIALRLPADDNNVASDVAYFTLDYANGTATAVTPF